MSIEDCVNASQAAYQAALQEGIRIGRAEQAAAVAELIAACGQASFCLRELLPSDTDAQLTVRMLTKAITKHTPCPYPVSGDDGTAAKCVARGHCGCDERAKYAAPDTHDDKDDRVMHVSTSPEDLAFDGKPILGRP